LVEYRHQNVEYAKMPRNVRSEVKRSTFWLGLFIGALTVLVVAAAFNSLEGWRVFFTAAISAHPVGDFNSVLFALVAGGLVGAFCGFYTAKHIAERSKRKKKFLTELVIPRNH
jgi:amino acid transporter